MVEYYRKRKRKRYRKNRASRDRRRSRHIDVTVSDAPADFLKQLEQGLTDGTIVAMGTFGDIPDLS